MLSNRRKQLERLGVVESAPKAGGRGNRYALTSSGHELFAVCQSLGTEICKTYPGLDEDLFITVQADAFVKWHAGQLEPAQATRDDRIRVDGAPSLVRAFPSWNARSMFAHIRPMAHSAAGAAGDAAGRSRYMLLSDQ